MYRVLAPPGVLSTYLELEAHELARNVCRALAVDPRPTSARAAPLGWRVDLSAWEWLLYDVDDQERLVTVFRAGRRVAREA